MNLASKWAWRITRFLRAPSAAGLDVGSVLPKGIVFTDTGGGKRPLRSGKKAVLWFTNLCEDCRSKAPLLEDLQRRGQGRVEVLAVSILPPEDPLPFHLAPSYGFPILVDPEDMVGNRLGLEHPPATCPIHNLFIVDERGQVLFRHHLSALSEAKFRDVCARLIGV